MSYTFDRRWYAMITKQLNYFVLNYNLQLSYSSLRPINIDVVVLFGGDLVSWKLVSYTNLCLIQCHFSCFNN